MTSTGKTTTTIFDALRMARGNSDAIIAAGELADMRFRSGASLSLRAGKLLLLMIQEAGLTVADDVQHKVPLAVLNETFHLNREDLLSAIEELHGATISIRLTSRNGRTYTKSGPLVSDVEREDDHLDAAEIRWTFSPTLRRVIADSDHWAAISRRAVLAFESKYALRLYVFLSRRANMRKTSEEIALDDLRELLGLKPDTLQRWQDLRRFALEPAIAEVSHLAGFHAAYTPIKRGRRITAVRLIWGLKDRDDLIAAAQELDRPRIGRAARRMGQVETITQERQRLADRLADAPLRNPADETT
jgi:hypothetical protein